LAAVVLVASVASVELGITVALIELTLGVALGNLFDLDSQEWLDFIASFASIVLTFLAGMEVDTDYMRDRARATVGIGAASFIGPFVVATLAAHVLLDWSGRASLIAGIALSTTSLAVVYATLVERNLSDTRIGKLLMSATFVTDLCTALALSVIFLKPNLWFPAFLVVSLALIVLLPRIAPAFFRRYGDRVIEPEIKLVFAALLLLMVLADASNGHAVLPAFVLGLMMSSHYEEHREEQTRLRVVAFAFLTPFFFLKGGLNVSLGAVAANLGVLAVLVAAKMVPKVAFVLPLARRAAPRHATFTTLLMSTGLTFGTISSLYGLNAGIIDRTQFSLLVTVVVLSAVVPTAIAERWFLPDPEQERHEERRHAPLPAEEFV
jgi:Kef-type K+ transport system membrane component KefB